jgi:hypothetical protein
MDDGAEVELRAGDVASIPPGHDAEVVGDEPCLTIEPRRPRMPTTRSRRPERTI